MLFCAVFYTQSVFARTDNPQRTLLPVEKYQTDEPSFRSIEESSLIITLAAPTDPVSDIEWDAGTSGVSDVQQAFNSARQAENQQLGLSIPMLTLPSQSEWDMKSDGEKALWLINRERIDRGIHPLHDIEENVTSVAQYYAEYLHDNNAWGHYEDGNSPWERLESNAAIGACSDFLNVAENLAVFMASDFSIPLPIERSVFNWMYDDRDTCTDTDDDGYGDPGFPHNTCEEDGCPDDTDKSSPGFCGCGVPDSGDADLDGIFDCVDQCDGNDASGDNDTDSICNDIDDDDDNDGMPDGWEIQYGLDPLVNDADGDLDGDGFNNLKEYNKETLPNDPESKPKTGMPWLQLLLGMLDKQEHNLWKKITGFI